MLKRPKKTFPGWAVEVKREKEEYQIILKKD
jgi:hypothetical protein